MNNNSPKDFPDIHAIMDEIFSTAEEIKQAVEQELSGKKSPFMSWSETRDYYPAYSFPPLNVYITQDAAIVFQFALAGFDEKDVSLEFKGDYMHFSAKLSETQEPPHEIRYLKRRLKLKSIDEQKYYLPSDKFCQEKAVAKLKNAILTITIPAREHSPEAEGIAIPIIKESTAN